MTGDRYGLKSGSFHSLLPFTLFVVIVMVPLIVRKSSGSTMHRYVRLKQTG